jgi:hypothetical protein
MQLVAQETPSGAQVVYGSHGALLEAQVPPPLQIEPFTIPAEQVAAPQTVLLEA